MTVADLRRRVAPGSIARSRRRQGPRPEDIFTIVYNRARPGRPGRVLTHGNMCFDAGLDGILSIAPRRASSLLPLAHSFAKILEWTSIARVGDRVRPRASRSSSPTCRRSADLHGRGAPVYEKAYAKIAGVPAKRQKASRRFVIYQALAAGKRRSVALQPPRARPLDNSASPSPTKRSSRRSGDLRRPPPLLISRRPLAREIAEFFHACGSCPTATA